MVESTKKTERKVKKSAGMEGVNFSTVLAQV